MGVCAPAPAERFVTVLPAAAEASAAVTNEQASTESTWALFVGLGVVPVEEFDIEPADPPQAAASRHTVRSVTRIITVGAVVCHSRSDGGNRSADKITGRAEVA